MEPCGKKYAHMDCKLDHYYVIRSDSSTDVCQYYYASITLHSYGEL